MEDLDTDGSQWAAESEEGALFSRDLASAKAGLGVLGSGAA